MNLRDFLTLLGSIFTGLAVQLKVAGTTSTTFWLSIILGTIGPLLMGVRSVIKAPDAPTLDPNATRKLLPVIAALCGLTTLSLTSCAGLKTAWGTAEARKATGRALLADAVSVLGKVAVAELQSLATGQLDADSSHAAATAAWSAVSTADLAQLVNDATGHAAPALAAQAAELAQKAVHGGATKARPREHAA